MGMRPQCLRRDIYTQNIWNDVYTASLVMYLYKVHSDIIMARQLKCIIPYYKKRTANTSYHCTIEHVQKTSAFNIHVQFFLPILARILYQSSLILLVCLVQILPITAHTTQVFRI